MLQEHRQQTALNLLLRHPAPHLARNIVKPFAFGGDGQFSVCLFYSDRLLDRKQLFARLRGRSTRRYSRGAHGNMVGERLQRNNLQNRRQKIGRRRGTSITSSATLRISRSPSVTIATTIPSRAFTS